MDIPGEHVFLVEMTSTMLEEDSDSTSTLKTAPLPLVDG